MWLEHGVQVLVQVQAPSIHLAMTPEGYSKRLLKALTALAIEGFDFDSWGRTVRALAQLLRFRRQAQKQGTSESAAVAAGHTKLT